MSRSTADVIKWLLSEISQIATDKATRSKRVMIGEMESDKPDFSEIARVPKEFIENASVCQTASALWNLVPDSIDDMVSIKKLIEAADYQESNNDKKCLSALTELTESVHLIWSQLTPNATAVQSPSVEDSTQQEEKDEDDIPLDEAIDAASLGDS